MAALLGGALLAAPPAAQGSECHKPASLRQLEGSLDDAEQAFAALDSDAFHAAAERATAQLPCLAQLLCPELAAQLHRVAGLRAYAARELEAAEAAFAAARIADPEARFSSEVAPEGNPLLLHFDALPLQERVVQVVAQPADGLLRFDGRTSCQRSGSWPTIAQVADGAGVRCTAYLLPGDPMPACAAERTGPAAENPSAALPPLEERSPWLELRESPSRGLLLGAGLSAAAAGSCLALGMLSADRYRDAGAPHAELEALRGQTNGLALGAIGAGALTAGLAIPAFLRLLQPPPRSSKAEGTVRLLPTAEARQVWLESGGARVPLGLVPVGRYAVMALFEGPDPVVAGQIEVRAGRSIVLRCEGAFTQCQPR